MNGEGDIEGDYLFIDRKSVKRQSSFQEGKLPDSQENFDFHGFGVSLENVNNIVKEDIGFSLNIYSEFWFEKTFYGSDKNWDSGEDNSFYAKHNSPRLNTFLRDLKDLWIGKYGWELGDFEGWYGSNQDGVFLDNKIVYLDNTES